MNISIFDPNTNKYHEKTLKVEHIKNDGVFKLCAKDAMNKAKDVKEIVNLSVKYQVLSKYTAMFACERIVDGPQQEIKLVRIPLVLATNESTIYVATLTGKKIELNVSLTKTIEDVK